MKTKFVTLFLALIAGVGTIFAQSGNWGNLTWDLTDGVLTISGTGGMIHIYSGRAPWYPYKADITDVIIDDSVTNIGSSAFYGCSGLTSVTIGSGVTNIGDKAFYGCSGLTSVTIPNSVTYIGTSAFYACSGLTSVAIPESVTMIDWYAFSGCSGLTSVTIPDSVTSIGQHAFQDVFNIVYNGSATWDRNDKGWGAKNVNGYIDGYLVYSDNTKSNLLDCSKAATGEIVIPNSVTNIGNSAFYGCSGLTSVTIPNSVTSIGDRAFYNCFGLTRVTIPNSVTSIGYLAFSDVPNIFYSGTATGSPWGARSVNGYVDGYFVYSDNTKTNLLACSKAATGEVVILNSVTNIENHAFFGCSGLTSVTIPNSVTSIRHNAFYGCTGLTSVTIPESVTSIDLYAFYSCSSLTNVTFNSNAIANLTTSSLDGTTKHVSLSNIFGEQVTKYIIGEHATSIGDSAFYGCSNLTSIEIPNSVKSIGSCVFSGCYSLMSMTIPKSVTNIGNSAFSGCYSLTSMTIPNSVTNIGDKAFYCCSGLTSVTIPNSVTRIGDYAFYHCSALTSIEIPNSVTSIGNEAFYGCFGLTSVTIGSGVTSIGDKAFSGCCGLTSVTCEAVIPPSCYVWWVFECVSKTIPLYVPCGAGADYAAADGWKDFTNIKEDSYEFTLLINDETMGSVAVTMRNCSESTITITATSNIGYEFSKWSDGNTDNPRTIELTQDTTFTAEFIKKSSITCEEAYDAALNGNTEEVTVIGYVTSIATAWHATYHNISFWMADTKNGGNVFKAFRVKCATQEEAPRVDDKVKVHGNLYNYYGTPELAEGGTFEILERASVDPTPSIDQMSNVQSPMGNGKFIKNGQLFIQLGEEIYNAQGVRVE